MLPNLGQLALADTGAFYELTDAERQQLDDDDVNDPITMERPVHTMTFRVRLADDNSDGTPRYKFFSPESLWTWVKNHDTLPARENPVWYEDWWALCNTYNPNHHNIPSWARSLKTRTQFLESRARAEARRAAEAAAVQENIRRNQEREQRERAEPRRDYEAERQQSRAQRNALEAFQIMNPEVPAEALNMQPRDPNAPPRNNQSASMENSARMRVRPEDSLQSLPRLRRGEERLGPQRNSDHLITWRCWIKGAVTNRTELANAIRRHFARTMSQIIGSPFGTVDHWEQRLIVKMDTFDRVVGRRNLADTGGQDSPCTRINLELYVPSPHANAIRIWLNNTLVAIGHTPAMETILGVQNAVQETIGTHNFGTLKNHGPYQRAPRDPNLPWQFPQLTMGWYQQWGHGGHVAENREPAPARPPSPPSSLPVGPQGRGPQSGEGSGNSMLRPAQVPRGGVNLEDVVRTLGPPHFPASTGSRPISRDEGEEVVWSLFLKGEEDWDSSDNRVQDWIKRHFRAAMRSAFVDREWYSMDWAGRLSINMGEVDQPLEGRGSLGQDAGVVAIKCTLRIYEGQARAITRWASELPEGVWLLLFSIRNAMGTLPRRAVPALEQPLFPPAAMTWHEYESWGDFQMA